VVSSFYVFRKNCIYLLSFLAFTPLILPNLFTVKISANETNFEVSLSFFRLLFLCYSSKYLLAKILKYTESIYSSIKVTNQLKQKMQTQI